MGNPLAELVTAHMQRTGDTLTEIAARGGMSRQTLSGLVNRAAPFPRQRTLEALARGLGLPYEVVRQVAYGSNHNGDTAPPRRVAVATMLAQAEQLDDTQLEVVLATMRALQASSKR